MKSSRISGCRHRLLGVLAVGVAGIAACAPAAHASVLGSSAGCAASATSQAFSQWGDDNQYELAPGGNFASASSGWTLTGGARIISFDVPLNLGAGTVGALYLPAGSTAQSPYMCVDASDPTYRFVGASTGGAIGLNAQALYRSPIGLQVPLTTSAVNLPSGWGPTPALLTGAAPASVISGGTAQMSLRFQAASTSLVDDVFVDPNMHH